MPNRYEHSGELAAVIAERDTLRKENDTLRKAVALYEASDNLVIKNEAKLAKAREALSDIAVFQPFEDDEPYQTIAVFAKQRARQTLKEIADEQAERD